MIDQKELFLETRGPIDVAFLLEHGVDIHLMNVEDLPKFWRQFLQMNGETLDIPEKTKWIRFGGKITVFFDGNK